MSLTIVCTCEAAKYMDCSVLYLEDPFEVPLKLLYKIPVIVAPRLQGIVPQLFRGKGI